MPVVKFLHGRIMALGVETFTSELAGVGMCSRTQIPLKLAAALTVHKCQVGGRAGAGAEACMQAHAMRSTRAAASRTKLLDRGKGAWGSFGGLCACMAA